MVLIKWIPVILLLFGSISCGSSKRGMSDADREALAIEYHDKGVKAYWDDEYEKAIEFYDKGIEVCPEMASLYSNRGSAVFALTGDTLRALKDWRQAQLLDPTDILALNRIAAFLFERKDFETALKYQDIIKRIKPDMPYVQQTIGVIKYWMEDYTGALDDFFQYSDEYPDDNPSTFYLIGECYISLGEKEKAVDYLIRSARLECEDAIEKLAELKVAY